MDSDEHDLPTRDPRSILFEADYWQAVLEEVGKINALTGDVSGALVKIPLALLEALSHGREPADFEAVGAAVHEAFLALERMHPPIMAAIELAGGRMHALRSEGGIDG